MNRRQKILKILERETYNDVNSAGDNIIATDHDLDNLSKRIAEALDNTNDIIVETMKHIKGTSTIQKKLIANDENGSPIKGEQASIDHQKIKQKIKNELWVDAELEFDGWQSTMSFNEFMRTVDKYEKAISNEGLNIY